MALVYIWQWSMAIGRKCHVMGGQVQVVVNGFYLNTQLLVCMHVSLSLSHSLSHLFSHAHRDLFLIHITYDPFLPILLCRKNMPNVTTVLCENEKV